MESETLILIFSFVARCFEGKVDISRLSISVLRSLPMAYTKNIQNVLWS